jgi:putative endonuclease
VSAAPGSVASVSGRAIDERSARGRAGEDAALRVYERRGFAVVARNWRCALGELDLVLVRRDLLVFCEVKARSGAAFGGGYESVTWTKRRKLRHLADAFLEQNRSSPARVRFDVASVWLGSRDADVEIFEDAF